MILSKSDESSYPRLVPDLRVKAFNILPLRMTLPVDVSVDGLYQMRKFPSITSLLGFFLFFFFYLERMLNFIKRFFLLLLI